MIKIPNKQGIQQTAFNQSADIGYDDFINFLRNVLQNHILF